MLKSFSIVKVIKKNWKVIALLVLLLVVALLVLALYPKVQEGASNPCLQTDATSTDATILAKGAKAPLSINLNLSSDAKKPHPGVTIAATSTGDSYKVSNLLPNLKYNANITDACGNSFAGKIVTLPDASNIIPPAFTSNDIKNTHTQLDANGNVACYIKFDVGVDLPYDKDVGADKSGFNVSSFTITDSKGTQYTNSIEANPETGEPGWCKVSGFNTPGQKYEISVSSTTNLKGLMNTIYTSAFNKTGKPDTLSSKKSQSIILYTAPVAVTNVTCTITDNNGKNISGNKTPVAPYKATVMFDTKNGSETSYVTSLNCDNSKKVEKKATVTGGKGTIVIENIPAGTNSPNCIVNAVVNCAKTTADPTNGTNNCSSVCNLTIPSNKKYKKKSTDAINSLPEPAGSTFNIITPN